MNPNFTLLLSMEGITLSQNGSAGPVTVGTADPASATLNDDLAALRLAALSLEPTGLRCKLMLPADQVRYLTVETPGLDTAARKAAAGEALASVTPYTIDDLVIDICVDGDDTHAAAVAQETLEEAENFAAEHQFTPVCFAAIPPAGAAFRGEARFGASTGVHAAPPDSAAESTSPDITEDDEAETLPTVKPAFVSRRRVPTFRTAASTDIPDAAAMGFAEPPASFGHEPEQSKPQNRPKTKAVLPAPAPTVRKPQSEADRFTIFGADGAARRRSGPPGAVLALGLVALAGVAAFASGVIGPNFTTYIDRVTHSEPEAQFTAPPDDTPARAPVPAPEELAPAPQIDLASLQQDMTDEDAAVLDALRDPVAVDPDVSETLVEDDPKARYAATGIWSEAPVVPNPSDLVDIEDLYVTSIDPINMNFDAVALPAVPNVRSDIAYLAPISPAPAGTQFELNDQGLVVATPDGAMNPDGVLVFAKPPAAEPPLNLLKTADPDIDLSERLRLVAFRPQARPADLIETTERATFSGLTRSELSEIRPRLRPPSEQDAARQTTLAGASLVRLDGDGSQSLLATPEDADLAGATARAVAASLRPDPRPGDFDKTVAKAQAAAPPTVTASAATVAPRAVTPRIPSSASTTREATVKNAINLRDVNLIGVYGKPSDRRALVRLTNGRYRKVQVGDTMDGGRVSAIGDAELRYQKRGRDIVLKMPRG